MRSIAKQINLIASSFSSPPLTSYGTSVSTLSQIQLMIIIIHRVFSRRRRAWMKHRPRVMDLWATTSCWSDGKIYLQYLQKVFELDALEELLLLLPCIPIRKSQPIHFTLEVVVAEKKKKSLQSCLYSRNSLFIATSQFIFFFFFSSAPQLLAIDRSIQLALEFGFQVNGEINV